MYDEAPKQDSVRTVTLDAQTRGLWAAWRETQEQERQQWSGEKAWVESNRVWTHENGEPLQPRLDQSAVQPARRTVRASADPPARHPAPVGDAGAARQADIKVVQERLGHRSRQITSDTYTSVLPQLLTAEAESTSAVVSRSKKAGPRREKPARPDVHHEAPGTGGDAEGDEPEEGLCPAA
ncbi:hypothetical protein GCM10010381_09700 [Streptomyces xantholiticus]|nr:hypothetical protein GCM10010381_09700 [Streptomyces xantholiticus]